MKVVKVRSPFIIEVNQSGQVGSKITISIWNGSAYPTSGTGFYSLSKSVPSASQINTSYNVSNYVKEFIDNIKPTYNDYPSFEQSNEWIKFQVKRYWYNGTAYTLLDTTEYVGVNGFLNYTDGYQNPTSTKLLLLANTNIINYYWEDPNNYVDRKIEYLNLLVEKDTTTTTTVTVKYERNDSGTYSSTQNQLIGFSGIYNLKIPISLVIVDGNFVYGCKVTITLTPVTGSPTVYVFNTYPICESKFTTVRCSFINRYGGWQDIIFFKQQTNLISAKGTDYKLTQTALNYNTSIGQFQMMNINGKQTVKLNTGWVDENYSELITDLLLSETVLLDSKPVTVKSQSSDLKTTLKDKNINYEIEFEYAYNLINDAI